MCPAISVTLSIHGVEANRDEESRYFFLFLEDVSFRLEETCICETMRTSQWCMIICQKMVQTKGQRTQTQEKMELECIKEDPRTDFDMDMIGAECRGYVSVKVVCVLCKMLNNR